MFLRLIFLLLFTPFFLLATETTYSEDFKNPLEPAFEKIYVTQDQLCTFCDGTYYFDDEGKRTKVTTVLHDYDGMYILLVKHQCPLCGKCWEGDEPDEEHGCPIFRRRYVPKVWSK